MLRITSTLLVASRIGQSSLYLTSVSDGRLLYRIASLTSILEYIGHVEDQLTEDEKEALAPSIKESTKLLGELEKIFNENASLEKHEGTSKLTSLKPRAVWRRLRIKPEDIQKLRQRITLNVHFLTAIKGFRDR